MEMAARPNLSAAFNTPSSASTVQCRPETHGRRLPRLFGVGLWRYWFRQLECKNLTGIPKDATVADEFSSDQSNQRFRGLWSRCAKSEEKARTADSVHELLTAHYSEPSRYYHSLGHLATCLRALDQAPGFECERDAVELCLWFHDAVYVPGAADNEVRSAELFRLWAEDALHVAIVEKVAGFILLTDHRTEPPSEGGRYAVDIDLSSFGADWDRFLEESRKVRAELPWVPDDEYFPAHIRFLNFLVKRPRIFYTDHFHALYEARGRENIRRLIALIGAAGNLRD